MTKSKSIKSKRKTKIVPYDVAEQLRTPEEMAAYLDAWFEEAPDDAAGIARAWADRASAGNEPGGKRGRVESGESIQGTQCGRQSELCDDLEGGAGSRRAAARSARMTISTCRV